MRGDATELEQLARLVGNPYMEPINSGELIENSLRESLGSISPYKVKEMEEEIYNHGDVIESTQLKKVASSRIESSINSSSIATSISMEKVLLALYDAREGLIEAFETCNINTKIASMLSGQINKIATCIRYIGGDVEKFEPLNHVSGLVAPNFFKNAQKVIETTAQCYSLGDVEAAKVLDNGKKIAIVFTGTNGDIAYKAAGTIVSEEWNGNEAIDYIYTPNSGKMSVKSFENGRWIDRSASGKYKIVWELEERQISELAAEKSKKTEKTEKSEEFKENHAQNESIIKEELEVIPNVISEEDNEEDISNPIH